MKNHQRILSKTIISFLFGAIFYYCVYSPTPVHADSFKFIVANDIVKGVRKKFKSFNSYQAEFIIVSQQSRKKSIRRGKVYFRKPDKMRMQFTNPRNQIVISNGKTVWLYLPSHKLLGEQTLTPEKKDSLFTKNIPIGMDRLFSLYHYSFAKGKQPRAVAMDGTKQKPEQFFILQLRQKVITSGFRKMLVYVDTNFFIRKIEAQTALGKTVTMVFNNIQTGVDLKDSLFIFDKKKYPIRSTVKNPLVQP